jgi:hypothetical protein
MSRSLTRVSCVSVFFALVCMPDYVAAAGAPASVFRPVLPKLRHAGFPVYLPSWLPPFERKVYPLVTVDARRRAYEIDLSFVPGTAATAALAFYLTANLDVLSPGPHARRVQLAAGVTGFLGSVPRTATDSLTIRWRRGGVVYVMGRLASERALIRSARSIVRLGG